MRSKDSSIISNITLTLIISCMGGDAPRKRLRWVGCIGEFIALRSNNRICVISRWSLYTWSVEEFEGSCALVGEVPVAAFLHYDHLVEAEGLEGESDTRESVDWKGGLGMIHVFVIFLLVSFLGEFGVGNTFLQISERW